MLLLRQQALFQAAGKSAADFQHFIVRKHRLVFGITGRLLLFNGRQVHHCCLVNARQQIRQSPKFYWISQVVQHPDFKHLHHLLIKTLTNTMAKQNDR